MKILSALAFFAALLTLSSAVATPTTRVGVSTALTGNAATYGTDIRNALIFANEKFGGGKFELLFEDDRCNGKDATTVAQKFVNVSKVSYVLGQACSSAILAAAPIYERGKVLVLSPSASAAAISQAGDYIYRTWPSDAQATEVLFSYLRKKHTAPGMLSEQTEYSQGFATAMEQLARGASLQLASESFLTENEDVRTTLLRLKQKGVDALFLNTQSEKTYLSSFRRVKDLGWDVPLYGAYWPGSKSFLEPTGNSADGIVFVDLPSPEDVLNSEGAKLYAEFVRQYGRPQSVPLMVGTTIEAFRALKQAVESGEDPREYLSRTTFHGIFGDWRFDRNGDIDGLGFTLKTIVNGKVALLPSS